ncbi:hypothetical protein BJX99DRAFT_255704 [Aspergillus californicus]
MRLPPRTGPQGYIDDSGAAGRVFGHRVTLPQLTDLPSQDANIGASARNFHPDMVQVRAVARRLAVAMETALNTPWSDNTVPEKGWFLAIRYGTANIKRYMGWYAATAPKAPSDGMLVYTCPVKVPLIVSFAQDILGAFIRDTLDTLAGLPPITIAGEAPYFRLESKIVTALLKCFTDNDLGTEKEAMDCMLPRTAQDGIVSKGTGRRQRRSSDGRGLRHDKERGAVALGELYRLALEEPVNHRFALSQTWLKSNATDWEFDFQSGIDRYSTAADALTADGPAAQNPDADDLLAAIEKGEQHRKKGLALYRAVLQGWPEVVVDLLELGAEPDYHDSEGKTPLCYAAQNGQLGIAIELLKAGALPQQADNRHREPLAYVAEVGHLPLVELLDGPSIARAVMIAFLNRYPPGQTNRRDIINMVDSTQRSALHWAAANGHSIAVTTLLEHFSAGFSGQEAMHAGVRLVDAMDARHYISPYLVVTGT